ncbi:bifunctional [glutamate--ammonia ligase]-adenylyl-L-tyrosine phosphorylase/[glutamate--ammonia-ligase] adenylyltransferase [soil metagenome]
MSVEKPNLLPITAPEPNERLEDFLTRAAAAHGWPVEARAADARLMHDLFSLAGTGQAALDTAAHVLRSLSFSADPPMALAHLDRYVRSRGDAAARELQSLRDNSEHLHFLASLFAFSDYLSEAVISHPEFLPQVFRGKGLNQEKSLAAYRAQAQEILRDVTEIDQRRATLVLLKTRELLRIGIRDLMELGDTETLCHELSNLAQAIVEVAYADCSARLLSRYGAPINEYDGKPTGFCIYAMGKFGAGELNFSSDIDLVYVYDEEGQTAGRLDDSVAPGLPRNITNHEFFGRLGRDIATYIGDHTHAGFLYRVDLRLRPEGAYGQIARSRSAFAAYLTGHAALWEKIAYLKCRFIAGDEMLAQLFDPIVQQFVFIENDADELFPEIARLKRRIDHDALTEETRALDIKRGVGGIREIEFIVAGLQLIHGEKIPALRIRPTLPAMDVLVAEKLMTRDDADQLTDAYHLFRRIEHTLQMMHESQTHRMPSGETEREALALRCGFLNPAKFEETLNAMRSYVRARFAETFRETEPAGKLTLIDYVFSEMEPPPEIIRDLAPVGLGDEDGFRALHRLAMGTQEHSPSAKAQRNFQRLLPDLLAELPAVAMPQQAVRQFDLLLRAAKGFSWVYDICLSNPLILKMFLRTLGFGSLLGRQMAAHPEWIDELFSSDGLREDRTERTTRETNLAFPNLAPDAALRQLRLFKQLEGFLISAQEVLAIAPSQSAAERSTMLAEAVLRGAAKICERIVLERTGQSALPARWAIIGLGGLGDRQVHITGDLDVAFVVERDGEWEGGGLVNWLDKIGQQIIREMSAITPEGQLWKVDARLRPDGKSGPLAATKDRFIQYYRTDAGLWEWQALTKARAVAGDVEFGGEVLRDLHALFAETGAPANPGPEICAMRARIEESIKLPRTARMDMKRGAGGIVTVEFLVQYFQLLHHNEAAKYFPLTTEQALDAFAKRGDLLLNDAEFTQHHLHLLRTIQRHHRLLWETTNDYLPLDGERYAALRRGLADQLQADLQQLDDLPARCARMQAIFDRIVC